MTVFGIQIYRGLFPLVKRSCFGLQLLVLLFSVEPHVCVGILLERNVSFRWSRIKWTIFVFWLAIVSATNQGANGQFSIIPVTHYPTVIYGAKDRLQDVQTGILVSIHPCCFTK